MPRNEPPSQPSNGSGRQPPDEDVDPEVVDPIDAEDHAPPFGDERVARAIRDDADGDALAGDDIMAVLDLDDLQQMDGPDA